MEFDLAKTQQVGSASQQPAPRPPGKEIPSILNKVGGSYSYQTEHYAARIVDKEGLKRNARHLLK
jgi:hypothetical protein